MAVRKKIIVTKKTKAKSPLRGPQKVTKKPQPTKKTKTAKSISSKTSARIIGKNKKTVLKKEIQRKVIRSPKRVVKKVKKKVSRIKKEPLALERSSRNPILKPTNHSWETQATFNPGAVMLDGKVHLIYRAIGNDDLSVFGYSESKDGHTISYRSPRPIYFAPASFEIRNPGMPRYLSPSGGGYGGCEDPRATFIEDRIYITYTSWNGYEVPRVALTSISVEDFLRKNWNWGRSVLISSPGQTNKNWVIFPEKINGKFAILHSITPEILIDYFDNLDFDGKTFIKSQHAAPFRKGAWDSRVRGVGPPPLKTKDGWLVIYHAIDEQDPGRYKIGAMLLDLKNPEKILYRSSTPILAPDEIYENEGYKSGIIYSCGAVIIGDTLLVYYGGADTVGCVASANLDQFLRDLKKTSSPRLKKKVMYHDQDQ